MDTPLQENSAFTIQNPKFCPRCGGRNLHTFIDEGNEIDERAVWAKDSVLDEHQCADCDGASFWM